MSSRSPRQRRWRPRRLASVRRQNRGPGAARTAATSELSMAVNCICLTVAAAMLAGRRSPQKSSQLSSLTMAFCELAPAPAKVRPAEPPPPAATPATVTASMLDVELAVVADGTIGRDLGVDDFRSRPRRGPPGPGWRRAYRCRRTPPRHRPRRPRRHHPPTGQWQWPPLRPPLYGRAVRRCQIDRPLAPTHGYRCAAGIAVEDQRFSTLLMIWLFEPVASRRRDRCQVPGRRSPSPRNADAQGEDGFRLCCLRRVRARSGNVEPPAEVAVESSMEARIVSSMESTAAAVPKAALPPTSWPPP